MANDVPFGALDANQNWQDQEAQDNLAAIEAAKAKPKRSWYDTANDVAHMPGRMLGALTSSQASPEADQAAMMPETFVNPLVKNTMDAVGGAIGSGVMAPGDALNNKIPQYDADGHISPEMIRRGFDTAALAGGGSVAGTAESAAPTLGRDLRVMGKKVGSGEPFPNQLIDHPTDAARPPWVSYPPGNPGYEGAEMPRFDLEHRPRGAVEAQIDSNLGWHANDAGLTSVSKTLPRPWETGSTLASDSAKPGAAIAAAEHAPPFYSGLEKAVAEHPQDVMPASQWAGTLANKPGVKPEELKYTGTSDMLAAKGDQSVTKAELQDHLENNKVQLGEVTKEAPPPWEKLPPKEQDKILDRFNDLDREERADYGDVHEFYQHLIDDDGLDHAARYGQFQLPGPRENYREKLLTLPQKNMDVAQSEKFLRGELNGDPRPRFPTDTDITTEAARRGFESGPGNYKSSHWDEPNVVAHLRMNDRTMNEPGYTVQNTKSGNTSKTFATPEEANAFAESLPASVFPHTRIMDTSVPKKSLHLEELQSDWHQDGRKLGYKGDQTDLERQLTKQRDDLAEQVAAAGEGHPKYEDRMDEITRINALLDRSGGNPKGVPDAPFKKNWHELGLKRALHEAAEGGYDRISWTPGENHPTNPKTLGRKGAEADAADRGMQGFYNKIIPDAMNKLGKPHGVQVQKGGVNPVWRLRDAEGKPGSSYVNRDAGEAFLRQHPEAAKYWSLQPDHQPVHYMDIPPSLRQSLLTKGMPLFEDSSPGAAVAAASHIGEGNVAAGLRPGGGGGAGGVAEAQGAAARLAGAVKPLEDLPQKPIQVGGGAYVPGPNAAVHKVAEDYMASTGRPYERVDRYHPIDPEHAAAIAKAYEEMPHAPNDPKVKASYDAMVKETTAQYQALKKSGLKIEAIPPGAPDPYAESPRLAHKDVAENNHLWFFPTEGGFGTDAASGGAKAANADGEHPLLQNTGETLNGRPLLANDLFRIVHDYFGHLKEGNGFRAAGEDNAFRTHSKMYSDLARPAMTTETRGQNSWLNYGPHGETNRTATAADTHYAEQKVGLMPDWTMKDRLLEDSSAGAGIATVNNLIDKNGLPIKGKDYSKASRKALDEIAAGPKGAGPLDLKSMNEIPNVPQKEMDRLVPPRGVSPRLQDALKNRNVVRGIEASIDKGMSTGADKWYHNEPLRRAFTDELGDAEGLKAFREFADMVSATSPRSDVPTNIRNGSYYYMHARSGEALPEQLPYPYGHVAQNLHRQNFETLTGAKRGDLSAAAPDTGTGWDIYKNPKPASFSQNLQGNLEPGTMDTHAFRNIAMRTKDPRFLETSISQIYKPGKDAGVDTMVKKYGEINGNKVVFRPQKLFKEGKLTMKEALDIPTFWASKPNENEYGAAERLYRQIAKRKGIPTADAQAAAWLGAGELTGLGTVGTHTFPELFNERVLYTAKMRGEDPKLTLKNFIRGNKPLLASGPPVPFGALDAKEDQ